MVCSTRRDIYGYYAVTVLCISSDCFSAEDSDSILSQLPKSVLKQTLQSTLISAAKRLFILATNNPLHILLYQKKNFYLTMAELMFGLGQTKKKKQTEAKVRNTKATLKDVTITETVESNVRSDQHDREKNEKAVRNATRGQLKDVTITETVETNYRAEQFGRDKDDKNVRAETKTNLRDVTITDTVESDVRNEQHARDKDWKETGKQQKAANTNFDMARELLDLT